MLIVKGQLFAITLSYQIIPNILFICAVLGIVLIILRHLPEAVAKKQNEGTAQVVEKLSQKGLPAMAISQIQSQGKLWGTKLWNFMLEAKDLKPTTVAGYKIKKIFGKQAVGAPKPLLAATPTTLQEVRNEKYFLNEIKNNPKDLNLYNELGKFYLDHGNYPDARDIYQYLSQHDSSNSEYYARLAKALYKLKNFTKAVENYDKSLQLDSTQPNRFYNKGLSLEALGQYQEAIDSFKIAVSLESQNPKYFLSIANIYIKLSNNYEAKSALKKALKLDPENQEIAEKLKSV